MAIPQNKEDLIFAIDSNFIKLKNELSTIPSEYARKNDLLGHAKNTQMSIHNLVAYLIGWGQLVLKWNDQMNKGITVEFPETGYKWNELGLLAQKFYSDYEAVDFVDLIRLLENTNSEIRNLIDQKSNEELYGTPWYGKWTLGRMIQLNTAAPFKNAFSRIRKWKKLNNLT